jgi:hypothetical protein
MSKCGEGSKNKQDEKVSIGDGFHGCAACYMEGH